MKHFRLGVVGTAALVLGVSLTGCSRDVSPMKWTSPPSAPSSTPDAQPRDAEIALTCGAVSLILTALHNADTDLRNSVTSESQWVDSINAVAVSYRAVHVFEGWGLQSEVAAMDSYMLHAVSMSSGARFDPSDRDFREAQDRIVQACKANGTPTAIYGATGG